MYNGKYRRVTVVVVEGVYIPSFSLVLSRITVPRTFTARSHTYDRPVPRREYLFDCVFSAG